MVTIGFMMEDYCRSVDEFVFEFEIKYSKISRASIIATCSKWESEYATSNYEAMFNIAYLHEEGKGYAEYVRRVLNDMWDYMIKNKVDGLEYRGFYIYPSNAEREEYDLIRGNLVQVEPLINRQE